MKLNFIYVICICFSISIFVLCSGKKNERPVVLAVGGAPSEVVFWENVAREFTEESGIPLELVRQPTDTDLRRQNLVTVLKAGKSTPDIFLMDVAWVAQFAASRWLEPLDSYLKASTLSDTLFFKSVIDNVDTYNNQRIAMPVYVDGGLLYYRKDLLEKYGYKQPPATWDEFIACAQTITEKERSVNTRFTGYVWQGAQYEGLTCNFLEFAGSNETPAIVIDSSLPVFNYVHNRRAAMLMHDLIYKYRISPENTFTDMKEEEVRQTFQNGHALFERNWPYAWKLHQSDESAVKGITGVALLPHFNDNRTASTLGGWHIGISRFSKNKEKAFRCIEYILSAKVQKQFALELGWNPGRSDIYNDKEVLEMLPHAPILKQAFEHAAVRPVVPYYSYISSVIQRYINAVISNKMDVESAFNDCEKELKVLTKRYSK